MAVIEQNGHAGNGGGPAAPEADLADVGQEQAPQAPAPALAGDDDQIGGMSVLRGLIVYGAVLAFAGLFIDFMVVISTARAGVKPSIDATLISAAAALSGVLGSAFALKIGVKASPAAVNHKLAQHLKDPSRSHAAARLRQALSLEPSATNDKSWPLTFGIWAYAVVASATVAVYVLNQNETPSSVKALAVTFGGYVLALLNMAYTGLAKGSGR
jgi:hypothetical protein